ncbi:hypothetical protein [Amycolatopsis sp. cmx-8-4]|uniref:hypothetical protein n=1 Tax=Amycolatopsis sp. cmx-8-4 TaxID=2790947 RepID=UPI00397DFF66
MGPAGDPMPFEAAGVLTLRAAPELAGTEEAEQAFAPALAVPPGTPVVVDLSAVTFLTLKPWCRCWLSWNGVPRKARPR